MLLNAIVDIKKIFVLVVKLIRLDAEDLLDRC
jgi:hypothetical protein